MNRRLVIIGASAMGRETCAYAREAGFDVKGFLDSRRRVFVAAGATVVRSFSSGKLVGTPAVRVDS